MTGYCHVIPPPPAAQQGLSLVEISIALVILGHNLRSSFPRKRESSSTHRWIPGSRFAHPGMTGKAAFSLVELSIVLVILGLLTGGILTGQNLIRSAELRKISSDFTRYESAYYQFKDRYFSLPGDMANTTDFWGSSASGCTAVDSGTCNGDGNGTISSNNEAVLFWNHLAAAGLIEGAYDGIWDGNAYRAGENSPAGPLSINNAHFAYGINAYVSYQRNVHSLAYCGGGACQHSILKPEEAWGIDKKLDDGLPMSGKIMGSGQQLGMGGPWVCTTTGTSPLTAPNPNGEYALSFNEVTCFLGYFFE